MLRADCHHQLASSRAFLEVNGRGNAVTLQRVPLAVEGSRQHHNLTVSFH